ncbi:MAG: sodium:proton antiporter [Anaerolineales bacterium]|nr:sodium:proton antiporter [Anaerolineales bacterium]MCX7754558.1 sodium:proton antiporter [Anaerolineales bacterium]MDW8277204.1 sodium:proton antiporter [Anaerolineales bacterium]
MNLITALVIGTLFAAGIYQILRRNVIRAAIGLALISNAINLYLFSMGTYNGLAAAYTTATEQISDPLPQALVLTAIVISAGGFAFVLGLLYVLSTRYKTSDSDEINGLKH